MLVVKVIDDRSLVVIHYTAQEGYDYADGTSGSLLTAKAVPVVSKMNTSGSPFTLAVIKKEVQYFDVQVDNIELLQYSYGVAVYTGDDAIARAHERLGESEYNIFFNNCESFVNWVITEKDESPQGGAAAVTGGMTALGVIGAVAMGIYAFFFRGKKND